jgi:hypothetical protein
MCIFKEYRHIFGKEDEGVHSIRLYNIAVVDVLLTVIFSIVISYTFNMNLIITLINMFLLAIIMHYLFGVKTTINNYMFSKNKMST